MDAGLRLLLLSAILAASQCATAEVLPDPTRPAVDLDASEGTGETAGRSAERPTRGLQSIIISPQYRAAIINGQAVRVGESYAGSRLVEIRESSVVFESASGKRVMELFPKVSIKKNSLARDKGAEESGKDASGEKTQPVRAVGEIK